MNAKPILRGLLAGLFGWSAGLTGAEPVPPPAACTATRALVIIDDTSNPRPWIVDQARSFRIDSPAAAVRAAMAGKPCVAVLDADPVFATIPGAAVPELVVRIRMIELKGTERNFARRASDAVGRYMSSYLGDPGDGIPVLRQVELGAELLCARSRILLTTASAKSGVAEEGMAEDNPKRLEDAAGQLAGLLLKLAAEAPQPCSDDRSGPGRSDKER